MAFRNSLLVLAISILLGCQQTSMIAAYPPPNFNGPVVSQIAAPSSYQPTPIPTGPVVSPAAPDTVPAAWIPPRNAEKRPWRWIVIHHSATPSGSAAKFDREHRAKGWDELGYHFVIGNGTMSGDGQIEVGPRWPKQKWGAHAKTPGNEYNDYGIGICLVGNFDVQRPTAAQQRSLARLVSYLMKTYRIPADRILAHGATKATDCPGRNISIAQIRKQATQVLTAQATPSGPRLASSTELLRDR
jgi:N-acetyl-anhydromuramyl-L-alanine amidase AmpD